MSDVLVFGGTSGIGKATADILAVYGATPRAVGRKHFDIQDRAKLAAFMDPFLEPARKIDIVYSVGINKLDWISDIPSSDFDDIMRVNVFGFVSVLKVVLQAHAVPNIVVVSSDAAVRPMRTSLVYCASKAALDMAVRCAARETATRGGRINAVSPGMVDHTEMTEYIDRRVPEVRGWSLEETLGYERSQSPTGLRLSKYDVAQVIVDVLNGPALQTGSIVTINGGR